VLVQSFHLFIYDCVVTVDTPSFPVSYYALAGKLMYFQIVNECNCFNAYIVELTLK